MYTMYNLPVHFVFGGKEDMHALRVLKQINVIPICGTQTRSLIF